MNESLERALDQLSLLKKTLNSEKMSHQNTLQQLETTYQIIDEMKGILKDEQDKNKLLARQIKDKSNKIEQISHEYEDQILGIKQLIERKDLQIKKYTQIKVTDYDMIRFRVISEVEAQHSEEIETLKRQMKKYEFLNNQSIYEIKVLKEKNSQYEKEIEELNNNFKSIEQQASSSHMRELNRVYGLLEQEKLARKQFQKVIERQTEKNKQTIKKYHKELQNMQLELLNLQQGKQNTQRYSNQHEPFTLIQLKESQFAIENQKLKHQLKQKNQEIYDLTKKLKAQTKQLKRRIDDLQKDLNESQYENKQLKQEIKTSKQIIEQQTAHKMKLQYEKKHSQMNQSHQFELSTKDRQIRQLRKQLNVMKSQPLAERSGADLQLQQERQKSYRLLQQNEQLKQQLKRSVVQITQFKKKPKRQEYQNRQTRTQSVQDVKEKLQAANAQIVTLLKDKIALNDKIAKMKLQN